MPEKISVFVWLGVTVLFAVIELITVQLTTVWFALGAFIAMLLAVFGVDNLAVQITVFAVVSAAALILTRPLVKKFINQKAQPTNADMAIGKTGIVTDTIDEITGKGEVKLGAAVWSAKSADGREIPKGTKVKVLRIEGVKLIVETE